MMSIECLKLFFRFNEQDENIDWFVEVASQNNITTGENKETLQKMHKVFDEVLSTNSRLAPFPSVTLPLEELVVSDMSPCQKIFWKNNDSLERCEVARFSRKQVEDGFESFVLVNVYPLDVPSFIFFFHFMFGLVVHYIEMFDLLDSYGLLQQEGSNFLILDNVMRGFYKDFPVLSYKMDESCGVVESHKSTQLDKGDKRFVRALGTFFGVRDENT
jgi:hypothetical protein